VPLPVNDSNEQRPHGWRGPGGWGGPGQRWRGRPGAIFFRFIFAFGFLTFLLLAILAIPVYLFSKGAGWDAGTAIRWWSLSCVFVLGLAWFFGRGMRSAFRNIASPLGDVMEAADRVAEGDLSVRIPERGVREFRQLARSFNRMAAGLENADRQRRNLTADVAHELRNPLHVIRGNLEGVLDGIYPADSEHIQATLDETRLLARLVEDLGTLSLAESGQLSLHLEKVQLTELLADVETSFGGQAEMQGLSLVVELEGPEDELVLVADYERLQQVLGNLVANALRHTPSGGRIAIKCTGSKREILLQVSDTGEGIPPDQLPHIFDRFWKSDPARTRRKGAGSGLGLAISRQLVRAMGGTIEADSQPGNGSSFTIRFGISDD